jgi:hypothetical protein
LGSDCLLQFGRFDLDGSAWLDSLGRLRLITSGRFSLVGSDGVTQFGWFNLTTVLNCEVILVRFSLVGSVSLGFFCWVQLDELVS